VRRRRTTSRRPAKKRNNAPTAARPASSTLADLQEQVIALTRDWVHKTANVQVGRGSTFVPKEYVDTNSSSCLSFMRSGKRRWVVAKKFTRRQVRFALGFQ
jgi:hypothetical protein